MTRPLHLETARQRRSQLYGWRSAELASLLSTLEADGTPSGHWQGRLMAITGLGWLPRFMARLLYGLLALPLNPWRGKSFDGESGANRWLWLRGPAFGYYRIGRATGPDGQPSVWLDYSVERNIRLLRRIRGEARLLQPGLWLCRMLWTGRNGTSTLLWFTLCADDDAA